MADRAEGVLRCIPEEDHTNGFFVACFVRGQIQPLNGDRKRRRGDIEKEGAEEAEEQTVASPELVNLGRGKSEAEMARRRRKKQKQKQKKRSAAI